MSIQFAKMAACLVGMGLAMGSTQSFAKTYYKWVDSQGSTHYTTTPPPKTAKKKGEYGVLKPTNLEHYKQGLNNFILQDQTNAIHFPRELSFREKYQYSFWNHK